MHLSTLANELPGELFGHDVEFSTLSTDTRSIVKGEVYLALVGENFDGNDFIEQAISKGASAAILSKSINSKIPLLRVADTHQALGRIAELNRIRSCARVIALTGSQGKTTVKEMIGTILSNRASTLVTAANLNNTIGVPLTLLQLNAGHSFAVIEMGANSHGEIAFSVRVARPDIALITNASATHIEGFGSLMGIVEAKGEIIDGLVENGVLLLNADDANYRTWVKRAAGKRVVLFSLINENRNASYYAKEIVINSKGQISFDMITPIGERAISMNLLGKHNVRNAIAAAAAAIETGASLDDVVVGLRKFAPVQGRLSPVRGMRNSKLIDDSYNANPNSYCAAIDVLMSFKGDRYLIAGDMKELGVESEAAHRLVGKYAANAGVDGLLAIGDQCKLMVEAFGNNARHFKDKADLIVECKKLARSNVVFLVKGSRGATMDTVVNELTGSEEL